MLIHEVTPHWINDIVAHFGRHQLAPCMGVSIDPILNDRVQVHRLYLQYGPGPGQRAPSLILKTPMGPALPGGTLSRHDPGAREAYYFRTLASSSSLWTAECYAIDFDASQRTSLLLFEDLLNQGLHQGDRVSGLPKAEAEAILSQLAVFHAHYWNKTCEPEYQELEILTAAVETASDAAVREYYQNAWPAVATCGLYSIPTEVVQLGNSLLSDPSWARRRLMERPQTIIHGDVHAENMFYRDGSEADKVALIDWEDLSVGSGLTDVAWLVTTSVNTRDTEWELDLVRGYYEDLVAAGVRNYTWLECQSDYRLAIEVAFVQGVLNSSIDLPGGAIELAAERELGQRYMLACERARTGELR